MTRIIAGTAGGRELRTPPGRGTRPTSDRVREALFSALEARDALSGAHVLDLYAGSGALGLEAASRGAAAVTLVESDRTAAGVIRDNAARLGLPATVLATTVSSALAGTAQEHDLVFLDPPYDLTEEALAANLSALVTGGWLAEASLVVVERSKRTAEPSWPEGLEPERLKKYGETVIWYATN
ncbi:16S rRNA (guanine(966)-N(2))-methyltransferase RsmD [Knoellia sp. Soil729]|uniref:16S rRNA (guanine(966)-N(2))-methyltransferase RsmD n=1 Tax=Knoellia sp. Soil729 TaxID=1736394 RepID=UPI000700A796|nr:16S rRNA (guanine(966)-N(2))-methyltransferase RsmD [Knoellia sp. Soil729]KRE41936.1 16S rRNA (guanine(966)-N(2))-methyltransferase RsmD [Knoellia sp. Soil729]